MARQVVVKEKVSLQYKFFMSSELSDVTFVLGNERIPGHRMIMATSSPYFRSMLFGQFEEAGQKEIRLNYTSDEAPIFKMIMAYLYRSEMSETLTFNQMVRMLTMAHEFMMDTIVKQLEKLLESYITRDTVLELVRIAHTYDLSSMLGKCINLIDYNSSMLIYQKDFLDLPVNLIVDILKRKTIKLSAIGTFNMILVKRNMDDRIADDDLRKLKSCVNLSQISVKDFKQIVRPSGFYTDSEYIDAMSDRNSLRDEVHQFQVDGFCGSPLVSSTPAKKHYQLNTVSHAVKLLSSESPKSLSFFSACRRAASRQVPAAYNPWCESMNDLLRKNNVQPIQRRRKICDDLYEGLSQIQRQRIVVGLFDYEEYFLTVFQRFIDPRALN